MTRTNVPYLQVRSDCILLYHLSTIRPGRKDRDGHKLFMSMPGSKTKTAYSGSMTVGAAKRISSAIDLLFQKTSYHNIYNPVIGKHMPFRLGFVTLTISSRSIIDYKDAYEKLLKPFLRKVRNTYSATYLWKAELQDRGQVHYHLTVDKFIHYKWIKQEWNNLQRKAGYLQNYALAKGHYNPNSTDVHSVKDIGNLHAYLLKYLIKDVYAKGTSQAMKKKHKFKGKIWDASNNLKGKRFSAIVTDTQYIAISNLMESGKVKVIELDHCTILKNLKRQEVLTPLQEVEYQNFLT